MNYKNYKDWINFSVATIEKFLENGIVVNDKKGFSNKKIVLKEEGFVLIEEFQSFNQFHYETTETIVSPSYLLSAFFGNKELLEQELENEIFFVSYIEFVEKMERAKKDAIRIQSEDSRKIQNKKIGMLFTKIKKEYFVRLKNKISHSKEKKSEFVLNLERMYQIEKLLNQYALQAILEEKYGYDIDGYLEDEMDFKRNVAGVDLIKEKVSWNSFVEKMLFYNEKQQKKDTEDWWFAVINNTQKDHYNPKGKTTILGLEEAILPGYPSHYQRLNVKNKGEGR